MTSNNLFIIIFILIILGLVIYIFYNKNPESVHEGYKNENNSKRKKSSKNKKRVRFDDNIEYKMLPAIDVDEILHSDDENMATSRCGINENEKIDIDQILSPSKKTGEKEILPANIENDDTAKEWYSAFDKPLMTNKEKKQYYDKVSKNYNDYEKSLDEFGRYQTDDSTVIKTDVTIDMFAPEKRNNKSCQGKAIKDIYNDMVKPPMAKPKRIKSESNENIIYENESEMNGGNISGCRLTGYDGVNDDYQMANFDNDF